MDAKRLSPDRQAHWKRIQDFRFDMPGASFSFSDRLAAENGWTLEYALEAIEEYKRFMFLICIAPHPLTPSDQVDQVWHLHLVYTHSYWDDFCGQVLERKIHHSPTQGGHAEASKYGDLYAKTLDLYQQTFGQAAPAALWPEGKQRFSDIHFRRVNTSRNWIIPKPKFIP